jgi:hypothetical protein
VISDNEEDEDGRERPVLNNGKERKQSQAKMIYI